MIKKMMLLAVSAAALLAFAVPAIAQADTLTEPEGVPLAKGAKVTATSANLKTVTPLGTLECEKVTLHFELLSNSPAVLEPLGEATTQNCSVAGLPVTITDGTVLSTLTLSEGAGEVGATFISDIYLSSNHTNPPFRTCHFSGNLGVTSTDGTDEIHVEGGLLSPTCGEGVMTGGFTVETSNGTPIIIDVE